MANAFKRSERNVFLCWNGILHQLTFALVYASLTISGFKCLGQTESPDGDVKLARVPAKSIDEAMKSIEVLPGFEVELVAAEPLVVDPIAMAFDPKGRLLVIEMIDYSEQDQDKLGRLRRLEDTDGDGKMDRVETMASGLSWPTALAITDAGTLVVHPPTMSLVRETSQGKFEIETISDGFARNNVQGMANSFRWGLDNRWHLSTSSNGASLKGKGIQGTLELKGRDLSLDPKKWNWQSEPGGGQHGMDFNRWGDKFLSSNSDHLQQSVAWNYPSLSTGSLVDPLILRRSIALDGPQADVFRLSPPEGWRTFRTQLRVTGKVPGMIEGGGRDAGYFTGATGVFIYDGDQWSDEDERICVVADVGGNLVHRKKLTEGGIQWSGERIDEGTELMRSSDLWFRPVQFGDGPDGCLYVVDMCREVIEHPLSLPPVIKSQLDLTSGRDKGRIWRLKKKDRPIRRTCEPLDTLATVPLAKFVEHPNGWHRETASRLLFERQDKGAIVPLQQIALNGSLPEGRLQALASLTGLQDSLELSLLEKAITDPHPRVAEFAILQLSKRVGDWKQNEKIISALKSRMSDPSLHVRTAIATLGPDWLPASESNSWITSLAKDHWQSQELRSVVERASSKSAATFLKGWTDSKKIEEMERPWLKSLMYQAIQAGEVSSLLSTIRPSDGNAPPSSDNSKTMVNLFSEIISKHPNVIGERDLGSLRPWIEKSLKPRIVELLNAKTKGSEFEISGSMGLLGLLDLKQRIELLQNCFDNGSPSVQAAALRSLSRQDRGCAELAMGKIATLTPELHAMVLREVAKRKETSSLVIDALENKKVELNQVPVDVWPLLNQHASKEVREKISGWRGKVNQVNWTDIADRYKKAWDLKPDTELGAALFKKHCAACHKVGTEGNEIGPGLASILSKSNDQLGLAVAEPSREVDPKYQVYQVLTTDGELVVGILEESGADQVMMRDSRGERRVVPRADIEKFTTLGKSLMPDGLIEQLDPVAFNNLIGFLRKTLTKR